MSVFRIFIIVLAALGAARAAAQTAEAAGDQTDLRRALDQAERGPLSAWPAIERRYRGHPLKPWLDYAALRRRLDSASADEVDELAERYADLPFVPALRTAWLRSRIVKRDWAGFRAAYRGEADAELRCADLVARLELGLDDVLGRDIAQVWTSPESLPGLCDAPFKALEDAGGISTELRRQRIDLALEAGNASLAKFLARPLPDAERLQVEAYADFLLAPSAAIATWPSDARSRQVVRDGLVRLARRDPAQAEALLASIVGTHAPDPAAAAAVRYAIALWSAASYLPETADRLGRVPDSAWDDRLYEWRAREAMARADWRAARAAILAMPDALAQQTRWRYFRARVEELLGLGSEARRLLAEVAVEPNYHGFLAADRLGWPYALCPLALDDNRERRERVAAVPGVQRALLLHEIGRRPWARMEWSAVQPALSAVERREAVRLAGELGWNDRAVFGLTSGEDLRYYALRFPTGYTRTLRVESQRHGLDPSWVAALVRAESAWMPDARSSADARGLMQLLPGTGAEVARKLGIAWAGADTLYRPLTNIRLGTAYLAAARDRFDGNVALATAAYNAGPSPVARWQRQRPLDPIDIWIETIPFFETREYVARIMAFSVIYDWRLRGEARSLAARLGLTDEEESRPFACPT
jgi:soluble lytic murein transglycosylase